MAADNLPVPSIYRWCVWSRTDSHFFDVWVPEDSGERERERVDQDWIHQWRAKCWANETAGTNGHPSGIDPVEIDQICWTPKSFSGSLRAWCDATRKLCPLNRRKRQSPGKLHGLCSQDVLRKPMLFWSTSRFHVLNSTNTYIYTYVFVPEPNNPFKKTLLALP